ncbi:MAG: DUF4911 domain-containing protein [Sandaracinaceae bacterium]|nr:DUF4911 domain-containing protein [Sandaracinaceae bacterium]
MRAAARKPPIPRGEGVRTLRLAMAREDVVVLGGILVGYDGLASLHGDHHDELVIVTTDAMLPRLEELLGELRAEIAMQRLED